MMVAGDEFGRTQEGNNNAWCQDNEISWINWNLLAGNRSLFEFFRKLIRLRREHPVFRRDDFFIPAHPENDPPQLHEISWQGLEPGKQDWSDTSQTLAFILSGSVLEEEDDDFFVMLNGHRETKQTFVVPKPPGVHRQRNWLKIIDTGREAPHDFVATESAQSVAPGAQLSVASMGCIVLQSRNGAVQ
jgi:glycogen operon protein